MLVFRSTAITSLMLATALALPARAQDAKQCAVDEGKPSEVARAYLTISQVAGAAAQNSKPDEIKSKLADGVHMLTQSGGQVENPVGHAYELGKMLVLWTLQPDVPLVVQRGAIGYATNPAGMISLPAAIDTAFGAVEKAMPECASETIKWRSQKGWINVVNQAIQELNAGAVDSAEIHARMSLEFNARAPYGFMVMGQVAQHRNQPDSAIAMFQKTIEVAGTDSMYVDVKQQTELNLANLASTTAAAAQDPAAKAKYGQLAKATFEKLANDPAASAAYRESARTGIVQVDLAMGDTASAKASYSAAVANPSQFTFTQLIQAGVAASRLNDDSSAIRLFHSAWVANPYHRDGLTNLAIYELKAQHFDTALVLLDRLKSVDPDGSNGRLAVLTYAGLAKKYQDLNKDIVARFQKAKTAAVKKVLTDSASLTADSNRVYTEKAVEANAKADSLPVIVTFSEFSNTNDKVTLAGSIANNSKSEQTYTMKVDFLDKTGAVVASQQQTVGPVPPQGAGRFSVTVTAPGITAFKYAPLEN